jgi:hypothetical protein
LMFAANLWLRLIATWALRAWRGTPNPRLIKFHHITSCFLCLIDAGFRCRKWRRAPGYNLGEKRSPDFLVIAGFY